MITCGKQVAETVGDTLIRQSDPQGMTEPIAPQHGQLLPNQSGATDWIKSHDQKNIFYWPPIVQID
jgi:hypothetical protein